MSEFEYLAIFVSIIFGIGITRLLGGAVRSVYDSDIDHTRIVLTLFFFLILILDWWTLFFEQDQIIWTLTVFSVIILWAVFHYVVAITLYPPRAVKTRESYEFRPRWFMWSFAVLAALDILQTTLRGSLFTVWTYLPFVSQYVLVAAIAAGVNKPLFYRGAAWWLLIVTILWSFGERRFLI